MTNLPTPVFAGNDILVGLTVNDAMAIVRPPAHDDLAVWIEYAGDNEAGANRCDYHFLVEDGEARQVLFDLLTIELPYENQLTTAQAATLFRIAADVEEWRGATRTPAVQPCEFEDALRRVRRSQHELARAITDRFLLRWQLYRAKWARREASH